jgi:uncharacterized membrane protein
MLIALGHLEAQMEDILVKPLLWVISLLLQVLDITKGFTFKDFQTGSRFQVLDIITIIGLTILQALMSVDPNIIHQLAHLTLGLL